MADPTGPDRRGRRARARVALRRAEGRRSSRRCSALDPDALRGDLPPLRHGLRRRPADALRPHGQRVHPRPLGRTAGSRSSASSSGAPTSMCATRRAACVRCSRRRSRPVARRGLQRRAHRRELPQARPRRADPRARPSAATVAYVHRNEDPRDYKVSFDKIRDRLGFETTLDRPRRDRGDPRRARRERASGTRSTAGTGTSPSIVPLFDLRLEPEDLEAVDGGARVGLADARAADASRRSRAAFAAQLGVAPRRRGLERAPPRCTSPTSPPASGPGDEVIVPPSPSRRPPTRSSTAAARRCSPTSSGRTTSSLDPEHVAALIGPRTKAVGAVHFAGYPAPVDRLRRAVRRARPRADRGRRARAERRLGGRKLGHLRPGRRVLVLLEQGPRVRRGRPARHGRRRGRGARPLAALAGDDLRDVEPQTRETLLRRRRARLQLPHGRAARGAAALAPRPARGRHRAAARADARATARLAGLPDVSSCPTTTTASSAPPATSCRCCSRTTAAADRGAPRSMRERPRRSRRASSIPPCTSSRPTASASPASRCRAPSASRAPRSRCRCSRT